MSEVNEILKKVTASIEEATGKFNAKAEEALTEAKKNGQLSAQTKDVVDKMATELNALKEAEKTLKASLGELEQHVAQMPLNNAAKVTETVGQVVINSEALKAFAASVEGFTNAAKVVAEGTAKPYSDIEFATKITPVTTIAHMFKASKQILDDFAQLQSTVDAEMRYGLKYVEEQEILFGDGTGVHLHGIVPQASAFVESQNGIDDLRLAMLQAQLARFPASGHVLHFIDWAKIELTKDSLGRYILANPASLTGPTLWGLPVVATEAAAFQGKFLTGAFNAAAQLYG